MMEDKELAEALNAFDGCCICETHPIVDVPTDKEPLPEGFMEVETLISELETDQEWRIGLEEARQELSETLYADKPQSLAALRLKKGWSQARLAKEIRLVVYNDSCPTHTEQWRSEFLGLPMGGGV